MKGPWFCIHRTCLCHWDFELPLSHLYPCGPIFPFSHHRGLTPPLQTPSTVLRVRFRAAARTSEVVVFELNGSLSALPLLVLSLTIFFNLLLLITKMPPSIWCLRSNNMPYLLIFSSCPNHPRDKKPWNRPGTHRSAEMRGSRRPRSDIRVVQGREKVRPLGSFESPMLTVHLLHLFTVRTMHDCIRMTWLVGLYHRVAWTVMQW